MTSATDAEREQLKWFLLDHAVHRHVLGAAYDFARMLFPDKEWNEVVGLVVEAMLELHDEGLILLFHADDDEGWRLKEADVEHLGRDQLIADLGALESDQWADDAVPFFDATAQGSEVLLSLPEGAVPETSGNVPLSPEGDRGKHIRGFTRLSSD